MWLSESKRAPKKTLSIINMILYELKMGLNELKCVSLNELKRARPLKLFDLRPKFCTK